MARSFPLAQRQLPLTRTRPGWLRFASKDVALQSNRGFTLIEVLLAGLITVMTMTAVARFSVSAMTGSQNKAIRSNIEAEILDNMERIQQKDSQLTWESIKAANEENAACNGQLTTGDSTTNVGPVTYLRTKFEEANGQYSVSAPKTFGAKINLSREIIAGPNATSAMTALIIYRFNTPEAKLRQEQRVLELNPNYAPHCFQL